jgi:hypothetical protein
MECKLTSSGVMTCSFSFQFVLYDTQFLREFLMLQYYAGYMDSRCQSTAVFVKEVDSLFNSFNYVTNKRDHHKVLCCRLSSKSKHLEHWQNAIHKIKSWTFLNKEGEQIHSPLSQTGRLVSIAAVSMCAEG